MGSIVEKLSVYRVAVAILFCIHAAYPALGQGTVRVAVASNFAGVQEALSKKFSESTGHHVKNSSGSTGKLYAQITNGGPYDIFLSADAEHAELLENSDIGVKDTRFTYAVGRLALYAPRISGIAKGADALSVSAIKHLAVANPRSAPYGAAAVATMEHLKIWDTYKDNIVYGENIAQTMQFVESGGAEAGFVAYSQVVDRPKDQFWIVPEALHPALKQDAILLAAGKDNAAAKAYLLFLQSEEARKIIAASGYSIPKT